jgi:cellulose synthase/poly-beta-1,6-N-acetylglucosamine synthase-like glycosyltransferase
MDSVLTNIAIVLTFFSWSVLAYYVVVNTIYLVLTVLAAVDFSKYLRRLPYAGHNDVFANPLTPAVSIIVPAHNEQAGIVDSVRAMLSLHYPQFEIVVVDDGSTDETFARVQAAFDLVQVPRRPIGNLAVMGRATSVHVPRNGEPVVVVRKVGAGTRADATNVGLNYAQHPLVCMIDADSLLDPSALMRVVKPFVDDPENVVATGGVVRPANGCEVVSGEIVDVKMPRSWLARIQVIEYLRSFLLGRTGWSTLQSLLIISGAFGMFRRDMVLEVGGMDPQTMGEDCELVAKIHKHLRSQGRRNYKVIFVSEPVCWTEVPTTFRVLARQRRRWTRGLAEVLWKHRDMMFSRRYGRIGMVVMPYFLVFELLGPIIELVGLLSIVALTGGWLASGYLGIESDLFNPQFALAFGLVALIYGFCLSVAAMTVEEFSFHRMRSRKDMAISFAASLFENIGYRQLHSLWRVQGIVWWLRRGSNEWGDMQRAGFSSQDVPATQREGAETEELVKQ